jgi:ribonuclease J
LVCRNGDLVRLAPSLGVVDEVPAGRLYKDGRLLVDGQARTVADRRRLSFGGFISAAIAIDERGEVVADPEFDMIGIPEKDDTGRPMLDIVEDAIEQTLESLPRGRRRDPDSVAESVRRAVRSVVAERWGKKPMCHIHVLTV